MCGIAGIFVPRGGPGVDRKLLEEMTGRLVHRGPDDSGFHVEPGIGLGFRRLSILDLEGGHQPIFNEDGSVGAVFNGEIYNFRELREELVGRGHRFRTRVDSEVLVHGWEEWGEAVVDRLRGMFAFGIWDRGRHGLFLARDRLGIKPLYYALRPDGSCLFASELKAILADPGLSRDLEPRAVETYFSLGYVPDPYSILRSVAKLPPGHVLRLGEGRVPRPREYWDVTFRTSASPGSGPALQEELLERLDESVRSHLLADVPLGAFLSGGIDSSAVVASMASVSRDPVRTCSISFGETAYDESPYARMVSRRFRTEHQEDRADPDCFGLLPRIVEAYDEPFSDNSALPTYLLCGLARRHVTVALSGDGGDETLGGYHRYRKFVQLAAVHRAVPESMRAVLLGAAASVAGWVGGGVRGAGRRASLASLRGDLVEAYERLVGISVPAARHPLYRPEFRAELQGYAAADHLREVHRRAPADDALSRVQYVDLKTYLPGEILTKVDRASMAHSLEVRVPLLDHRWVEWTATLSPADKLHRGQGKHVFREALRGRLPATVLDRRKKGFSIPVNGWLAGPLAPEVDERLLGPGLGASGVLEPGAVHRLVEEHRAGRRNHGALLWALLMFQACWERLRSL